MCRKVIYTILLALCIVACSPYSTGDNQTDALKESLPESILLMESRPRYVQMELMENLRVDAELTYPEKESYSVYNAMYKQASTENRNTRKIMDMIWGENQGEIFSEDDVSFFGGISSAEGHCIEYMTAYYPRCSYEMNRDQGGVGAYEFIQTQADKMHQYREDFDGINESKELEGFSSEQAISKVKEAANLLDIELTSSPKVCIALSKDDLELLCQEEESYTQVFYKPIADMQGEELYQWQDADACYYILWEHEFEGVPFSYGNLEANKIIKFGEKQDSGSFLYAVLNKDGEWMRLVSNVGFEAIEIKEESCQLKVTVDDVLDIIKEKYENEILSSGMIVTDIRFCYMPQTISLDEGNEQFEVYPGYEVFIESEEMAIMSAVLRINGITGEVMSY